MSDVMTFIVNPEAAETDPDGRLVSLGEWSEAIARQKAAEEGIELTDKHWEVIRFLREHYKRNDVRTARALLDSVAEKFEAEGGRKYLYRLFPQGPVTQGCKIAGLPTPDGSQDRSFGTTM
jgi:TusE/DsrC/DsvC family sulfur relay protein